ncbi:phosphatase and actin regulator 2 [Trichonephila clavipes]|uniref:Phosphatase and actin regulator 2 n=1 Tax=Trichonephila clavipes TaxID=2585209 RepID=A0A8X6WBK6_TRICX|nr:phosphatase and actin regulator 2 [Trichonephila clavipes]
MYKNALKEDLIRVVEELDGIVESSDTIVKLKTKIENSSTFESDPDFVKTLIQNCIDERVSQKRKRVLCKKANSAMKTSSVEFISRSPNPLPVKSNYRRFVLLRKIFEPWQWKRRKKRNRFEQTSRTLQRKISMRSTKDQLVKKDVLMPVKHNVFLWNLPDVEEMPSHDGKTDSPFGLYGRTAADSVQSGWADCGSQKPNMPKPSRAGAANQKLKTLGH